MSDQQKQNIALALQALQRAGHITGWKFVNGQLKVDWTPEGIRTAGLLAKAHRDMPVNGAVWIYILGICQVNLPPGSIVNN